MKFAEFSFRDFPKSLRCVCGVALRSAEKALLGPFRPPYTGQIRARTRPNTPFRTVSPRTPVIGARDRAEAALSAGPSFCPIIRFAVIEVSIGVVVLGVFIAFIRTRLPGQDRRSHKHHCRQQPQEQHQPSQLFRPPKARPYSISRQFAKNPPFRIRAGLCRPATIAVRQPGYLLPSSSRRPLGFAPPLHSGFAFIAAPRRQRPTCAA
jgi:hypothetical protein